MYLMQLNQCNADTAEFSIRLDQSGAGVTPAGKNNLASIRNICLWRISRFPMARGCTNDGICEETC
jgi:hypothetical protein